MDGLKEAAFLSKFSKFRSSGPVSFGYSELENNNHAASILTSADFAVQTTPGIDRVNTSLKTELMVFALSFSNLASH